MNSRWLLEGHFLQLEDTFYFVRQKERARYVYKWEETISSDSESGPYNIEDLKPLATDRLFQGIFGVRSSCLIYLNTPTDKRLWGTDKKPLATSSLREVGFVDKDISPFESPDFETEFWLQKGANFEFPAMYAYNPTNTNLRPQLRFEINMMRIEPVTEPETLDKLSKKLIPYRPITMGGVPASRTGRGH